MQSSVRSFPQEPHTRTLPLRSRKKTADAMIGGDLSQGSGSIEAMSIGSLCVLQSVGEVKECAGGVAVPWA